MSLPRCSLCNRPAVWLILESLFCEVHKERVIEKWGVDHFSIKRFDASDDLFKVRGRHKQATATAVQDRKNLHTP